MDWVTNEEEMLLQLTVLTEDQGTSDEHLARAAHETLNMSRAACFYNRTRDIEIETQGQRDPHPTQEQHALQVNLKTSQLISPLKSPSTAILATKLGTFEDIGLHT